MSRPRLKIVCADHDEVCAKVVDTDEGPAYTTWFLGSALPGTTLDQFRTLRGMIEFGVLTVLDPSEDPIEDPRPYQLAARGPVPAFCRRCRRSRGDLNVKDLIAQRGTWRI